MEGVERRRISTNPSKRSPMTFEYSAKKLFISRNLTADNYTDENQKYKCEDEKQRAEEGMEESVRRLCAISVCNQ
jgi:hypothetical protein